MAFQKGLGAVHALSHPLGAIQPLNPHHGTLNAVVMPAVLRFNQATEGIAWKYERLRSVLGLPADADLSEHISAFNRALGLPSGLAAMGITSDMLPAIVPHALKDHSLASNPRPVDADQMLGLMRDSM